MTEEVQSDSGRLPPTPTPDLVSIPHPEDVSQNSNDRQINNILHNLYSDSSNDESLSMDDSDFSLDERFFSIEEDERLSKKDRKKLQKKRVGESTSKCTVCLDQFQKRQIIQVLPCHHKFHYKCLKPWFDKSTFCPLCRMDIKKHFNPVPEAISVKEGSQRNPLLDTSFIQPRRLVFPNINETIRERFGHYIKCSYKSVYSGHPAFSLKIIYKSQAEFSLNIKIRS